MGTMGADILQLKVDCSNFDPVQDLAIYGLSVVGVKGGLPCLKI